MTAVPYRWELGWDGLAAPVTGTVCGLLDARAAAEDAAMAQEGLWSRPGAYVRISGPTGRTWLLRPVEGRAGRVRWERGPAQAPSRPVRAAA